jgi:hypothetical protein
LFYVGGELFVAGAPGWEIEKMVAKGLRGEGSENPCGNKFSEFDTL